ncbi:MAG: VTT domain-containing protein [Legionellaceae bacterium]|nr:VTT domain-containing protein [Legionellaceae bacterium]
MQFFADYMQTITHWLSLHPHWALLITFLISFSESLAIIGSIIPGSVTMTAIGILAGSGVMRVDLTLLAAILGAIAGDSASYFIGYWYRERLVNIWPFTRYPQLLRYGQSYFIEHGGKSVLIGRFAGPLRSIIPIIAGMMQMPQLNFIIANVISAIGWSILYVMPGVLIGAASADLSAEVATRLFVYILIAILMAWLAGISLRWLIIRLNRWLEKNLHHFWRFSARHPVFNRLVSFITPQGERNHYPTVFFLAISLFCFINLIILSFLLYQGGWLLHLNQSLYYFFQSLRTVYFDWFFSMMAMFYSPITLALVTLVVSITSMFRRQYRLFLYWVLLVLSTTILAALLNHIIASFHPVNIDVLARSSYPPILLTLMIALMLFTSLICLRELHKLRSILYAYLCAFLILLCCLSSLYFSEHWFSDILSSLLLGIFTAVTGYIFYRRRPSPRYSPSYVLPLLLLWFLGAIISNTFLLKSFVAEHKLSYPQQALEMSAWWNQSEDSLPRYRRNRLGKPVDLFNLQLSGSLTQFKTRAKTAGWESIDKSFWQMLIDKMSQTKDSPALPILKQLYLNQKPSLIMVHKVQDQEFLLQFWQSNFYIQSPASPIYFISLSPVDIKGKRQRGSYAVEHNQFEKLLQQTFSALDPCFMIKEFTLHHTKTVDWNSKVPPKIYLIRENSLCR